MKIVSLVSVFTPLLQTKLDRDKVMLTLRVFPESGQWAIYRPAITQLIDLPCPKKSWVPPPIPTNAQQMNLRDCSSPSRDSSVEHWWEWEGGPRIFWGKGDQ